MFQLRYFGAKIKNWQFKLKFGTKTNLNMHNSVMVFTFSVFGQKYHFWANLAQQIKNISLSCNHQGAEISVIWLVEQSAIKLLILIRY